MAEKKSQNGAADAPNPLGWMVTFSDLVTLLLTFFVLLVSMQSMDVKAIEQAFGMFSGGSGPLNFADSGRLSKFQILMEQIDVIPPSQLNMEQIKVELFDFQDVEFQKMMDIVDRDIRIIKDDRGLVIQLADYILFNEGGSELRPEFLPVLSRVSDLLRATRRPVSVEGHTGASVLEGGAEAWAWQLSLDRAIAVTQFFVKDEGLLEERFRVGGFGTSRPIAKDNTPEEQAKNRRIEIIIYKGSLE